MYTKKVVAPVPRRSTPQVSPKSLESPKQASPKSIAESFEDINVVKVLSKAKFPVYLAHSAAKNQNYALKLFNFEDGKPHAYFKNEIRFAPLNHPNIIKIIYSEEKPHIASDDRDKNVSCILMEYAPYGDVFDFVKKARRNISEKLARTYFRQLIDGIEYLHNHKVCHFDLKLENLLIGQDYQLKIADFDLSFIEGDKRVLTKGTKFYRAPELKACKDNVGPSADIYAAGIILFVLKCGGVIPHAEDELYKGVNLLELLNTNPTEFFKKHSTIQNQNLSFFDEDFKSLFVAMTKPEAGQRCTIKDVKKSKWYNGPVYTKEELKHKVKGLLSQ